MTQSSWFSWMSFSAKTPSAGPLQLLQPPWMRIRVGSHQIPTDRSHVSMPNGLLLGGIADVAILLLLYGPRCDKEVLMPLLASYDKC